MKTIVNTLLILVFTSAFSFAQWTTQATNFGGALYSVSAVTDNIAWTCGDSGVVLRTTNGGANWEKVRQNDEYRLFTIFAVDAQTALVASFNNLDAYVFRTSNGGQNWTQVFYQDSGFVNAIRMTSATHGYMFGNPVGNRWSLWKTSNGGVTWDSTGLNLPAAPSDRGSYNSVFVRGNEIFMGTQNNRIYYSSNGGASFTNYATNAGAATFHTSFGIWFNGSVGIIAANSKLLRTTNNGQTYATVSPGFFNHYAVTGRGTEFWTIRESSIWYSNDNGVTFTQVSAIPFLQQYQHIEAARHGSSSVWAVGTSSASGYVAKLSTVTGVTQTGTEVPGSFALKQNYPNPFNPSTVINYQLASMGNVSLKVYDLTGKEVANLVNGNQNAGSYQVTFDGSKLSSGIYYYSLKAGSFTATKKMMLVK